MTRLLRRALALAAVGFLSVALPVRAEGDNRERDMYIVGSTFLEPFVRSAVGNLVSRKVVNPPKMEFAGTGKGVDLFCGPHGFDGPDVVAMSRRIRLTEVDKCKEHEIAEIIEIQLGLSALVVVVRKDDTGFDANGISLLNFYRAIAAELPRDTEFVPNRFNMWAEVFGALPTAPIRALVPAPGLGSRGFFEDRFLEAACRNIVEIRNIFAAKERVAQCIGLRRDGRIGEIGIPFDKNLRDAMVAAPKGTLAITPLNMAKGMLDVVKVLPFDGIEPTPEALANRDYPFVRPLYVYVKKDHVKNSKGEGPVRGLRELITELTRESVIGPEGYLVKDGLEPLSASRRERVRSAALRLEAVER